MLCQNSGALDFGNPCVRTIWSTLLPAVFVFLLCTKALFPDIIQKATKPLSETFPHFIGLHEAEAFDESGEKPRTDEDTLPESRVEVENLVPLWRTILLSFVALLETLFWLGAACYTFVARSEDVWDGISSILIALTWLYAVCRPIMRPTATPPYDLFVLYILHLTMGITLFGGVAYAKDVYDTPLPPTSVIVAQVFNIIAVLVLLGVVVSMPLGIRSNRVKKADIGVSVSPEDYTSLWNWISFSWIFPIVRKGTSTTLNESDVWNLSPTMQSRPTLNKFLNTEGNTLFWQLWAANSRDILVDFLLTYVSVTFDYAGPFFLRKILSSLDKGTPTREDRSNAYIFAILMFICTLLKGQSDVNHLWRGRRAATRIRSELMAAIYDKALKRKDYSGIIDKEKQKEAAEKAADSNGTAPNKDKDKAKDAKANEPKAGADVGKIVNLMSVDCNRIAMSLSAMSIFYAAPLEVIFATVFLYRLLGWSTFAGYLVLLAGWPLNSFIMKRAIRIQKGLAVARDKRMQVVNELIGAIKFIKFFAWENKWVQRVLDARQTELRWLIQSRKNSVLFQASFTCAPVLVAVVSFFIFIISGHEMTVSIAFTSITLFNMVRQPLTGIPAYVIHIMEAKVSLDRIATFLEEDEVTDQVSTLKRSNSGLPTLDGDDDDSGLGIENGSFKWNEIEEKMPNSDGAVSSSTRIAVGQEVEDPDHQFELKDIDIKFPEGQLSLITGPTASGKTALLMALLGEMTLLPGGRIIMTKNTSKVDENGLMQAISYAAQSPWLRHQSIKDNILFGYPYDKDRYNDVVECCALQQDLDMLEDGDATEIGARGVSLSGGQKARVALARAVYARTKYVLLDDPLSAVDSHTSRFLFDRLIQGPLLANRTVLLVTHHVELVLPGADYLVRMLDGRIDTQGTIKDLRAQGVLESITQDVTVQIEESSAPISKVPDDSKSDEASPSESAKNIKTPRKLIEDEHRAVGGVKWSIYKTYLKASWYGTWAILGCFVIVSEIVGVTEKVWMGIWGDAYGPEGSRQTAQTSVFAPYTVSRGQPVSDGFIATYHLPLHWQFVQPSSGTNIASLPRAQDHPLFYVGVYSLIGLTTGVVNVLSIIVMYAGALRASRLLFRRLLDGVVHATMRWHDTTPQGRMLNRFGKDIETVDGSLARSLQDVNSSLATFVAAVITVAYFFPLFLIPAFLIGLLYRQLAIGYLNTGRDLRRMESNSRSPIFSGFGEMLEGLVTVRAFSAERQFLDGLHGKIDITTKMWYTFWMTNRWLLLRFDALGAVGVFITTLFALSGLVPARIAGLCITSSMAFTMSIYWACRQWTALELDLNSVERVVEYLDLPQEPPAIIESNRPPAYWPSSARNDALIRIEDLVVKYAPELPAVLHGISFSLQAKERIGLLGRTGSGKSTLAMSILRFVDPVSGRIIIDGIDISTIGIHDLRSRLTFIPQDATLFSGSLRDNLDPFGEYEDSECLDVLFRVQLLSESAYPSRRASREPSRAPSVHDDAESSISATATDVDTKTKISLDTQISAGGGNFSQGQRQLIAMARALLRRSSIIVLDEATSSIDFATDAKIQTTIREEFNDSLLLTVAHRLRTVIDYDRLIVLDKGKIAEFDTPLNLINKKDGIFRNMCLKSGTFGELEAEAKAKAERDLNSM